MLSIRRLLASKDSISLDKLEGRLRALKGALATTTASELIVSHCPRWNQQPSMHHLIKGIDHVGFIGPVGADLDAVTKTAVAAGFDINVRSKQSVIVAVELGAMVNEPTVSTTIFEADACVDDGRKVSVEIFIPDAAESGVKLWLEAGVAAHVALFLSEKDAFRDLKRFLEDEGFRVPSFKGATPLTAIPQADGRQFLSMYLDRRDEHGTARIELCCYVSTVTPSLYPQ
jgi:hypothetical protein